MTAELSAEEIVTNLLSSHQILKSSKENSFLTYKDSLGEFLKTIPIENDCEIENDSEEFSKYTFIKGKWNI